MWPLFFATPNINVSTISVIELNPESSLTISCLRTNRLSGDSAKFSKCCSFSLESSLVKPRQRFVHRLVVVVFAIIVNEDRCVAGFYIVGVEALRWLDGLSDHAHAVDLGFRDRADHPRGGEMVFDGNADGNTGEQDAFLNAREIFEPRYPRTPRRAEVGDRRTRPVW